MVGDGTETVASRGAGGDDVGTVHAVDESVHGLYAGDGCSDDDGEEVEVMIVVWGRIPPALGIGRRGSPLSFSAQGQDR